MATRLFNLLCYVFDTFLWPFRSLPPLVGLVAVSFVTGVLFLLIYPYVSGQEAIRRTKDRIKAHLLELLLFKDDMVVTLRAQGRLLVWNFRYLALNLAPMVVLIVPFMLVLVHLHYWYGYRPLRPGESVLVTAQVEKGTNLVELPVSVTVGKGLAAEVEGHRSADGVVSFRLRAVEEGTHPVTLQVGEQRFKKTITVSSHLARVVPLMHRDGLWAAFTSPGDPALPAGSLLREIRVHYPSAKVSCLGFKLPEWLVYLVLILLFGFGLKGFFGVEI